MIKYAKHIGLRESKGDCTKRALGKPFVVALCD
jgi:hypothetical protein